MAEFLGIPMPDVSFFGAGAEGTLFGNILFFLVVIVAGVMIVGLFGFMLYMRKVFKYKVVVYENVGGRGYQKSFTDRARIVKLGQGGEEILYLMKKKVYRSAYARKMGTNEFWYAIGQDGYWYNIVLGDLDAKMGMLDIEPIDRDMRYMHVAIRKNIADRFKKINFMDKYGTYISMGLFLIIMLVGLGYLVSQMGDISSINKETIKNSNSLVDANKQTAVATESLINELRNLVAEIRETRRIERAPPPPPIVQVVSPMVNEGNETT